MDQGDLQALPCGEEEAGVNAVITRAWAMPNANTLQISWIAEVVKAYLNSYPGTWIEPFAGFNPMVEESNDLNPTAPTKFHMHAPDFIKQYDRIDGAIIDPPYSPTPIARVYKSIGLKVSRTETQHAGLIAEVKNLVAERMSPGGIAITCGWNSNGLGKGRGFDLVEILMVAHGASHNDTIVTVEQKTSTKPPTSEKERA